MSGSDLVFPETKLLGLVISKLNNDDLSPNFHIHVSVSDLYIPRTRLPILLQIFGTVQVLDPAQWIR